MKPTVAYASFCCPKDMGRVVENYGRHLESHRHAFDEIFIVYQRCNDGPVRLMMVRDGEPVNNVHIRNEDYPGILHPFGIPFPDERYSELTHGWGAPHFYAHHLVNHLRILQIARSDFLVFADGDCYMETQPEAGPNWIEVGIDILTHDPKVFVVSPSDGGDERRDSIMSQQMFIIRRQDFLNMKFIPWDGKFMEGGPFQEYYALLEGWIDRFMRANNLKRYVLSKRWRYHHLQWH